jgi:hypothetical protein
MNIGTASLTLLGVFVFIYVLTVVRTWKWNSNPGFNSLRGLALPSGSIRGLIAFMVIGGFLVFAFFGVNIFPTEITSPDGTITKGYDASLFNTVLTAFGTLTGAVAGFYFGGRGAQPKPEEPKLEEPKLEEPKSKEPKSKEPKSKEPKSKEPKSEEPNPEEPNPNR